MWDAVCGVWFAYLGSPDLPGKSLGSESTLCSKPLGFDESVAPVG